MTNEVESLIKRAKAALKRKHQWDSLLKEAYRFCLPQREIFDHHSPGSKKNAHIYDSTAQVAIHRFASRIHSAITPPWKEWAKLMPGTNHGKEIRESSSVKENLDLMNEVLFSFIHQSNFSQQINEAYLDLGVSTGAVTFQWDATGRKFEFEAIPLAQIVAEEGPAGIIQTVWRFHDMTVDQIAQKWPGGSIPAKIDLPESNQKRYEEKHPVIEGVIYEPQTDNYREVVILEKEKEIVFEQNHGISSPWIVFRWSVVPGEVYGRGPGITMLPTIKSANKVVEFTLRNAAMHIAGAYTSTDTSAINPYTARIQPAMIIPVASNDNRNPSMRALERSGDFNVSNLILDEMREVIKEAFFNNRRTAEGPVKSATEIALDNIELIEDMGASFGRLMAEGPNQVLSRGLHLLGEMGELPRVRLDGRDLDVQFVSPLARAQDQEDIIGIQQTLEITQALGPEIAAQSMRIEDLPAYIHEKTGGDAKLIRSEAEREQIKQTMAQVAQAEVDNAVS